MVKTSTVALAGGGVALGAGALYYLTKSGGGGGTQYSKAATYWADQFHKEKTHPQNFTKKQLRSDAAGAKSSAASANAAMQQRGCSLPMPMSEAQSTADSFSTQAQKSLWWKRYAVSENKAANACIGASNQKFYTHLAEIGLLALMTIPLNQFAKWLRGRQGGGGGGSSSGGGGSSSSGSSGSSSSGSSSSGGTPTPTPKKDTLTVKALEAASGIVLGGVFVAVSDSAGNLVTEKRTDFEGIAKIAGLTDGALYTVAISTSGYKPVKQTVTMSPGATLTAHLHSLPSSTPSSNPAMNPASKSHSALAAAAGAIGTTASAIISDPTALVLMVAIAGSLLIPVVGEADAIPLAAALASELGLDLSAGEIVSALSGLTDGVLTELSNIAVPATA